jgi:hypothetical protein
MNPQTEKLIAAIEEEGVLDINPLLAALSACNDADAALILRIAGYMAEEDFTHDDLIALWDITKLHNWSETTHLLTMNHAATLRQIYDIEISGEA